MTKPGRLNGTPPEIKFIYGIAIAFVGLFLVYPIVNLIFSSFVSVFGTTEPLPDKFFSYMLKVTWNTFYLAFLTTSASLVVALPLAVLVTKFRVRSTGMWIGLLTLPLITPAFISSFSVIILLGRTGVLTKLFKLVGIQFPQIYGLLGLVITQTLHTIPYSLLVLIAGLKTVPRHVEEAAQSMGAGIMKTLFTIVIPGIYPHILMAVVMVFLTSIGDIGGPLIIGGRYKVISMEIYSNFISYLGDERIPLIFSAWLILLSCILMIGVNKLMRLTNVKGKFRVGIMEYDKPKARIAGTAFIAFITLVLMLPYIAMIIQSFATRWNNSWLPAAYTLDAYKKLLGEGDTILKTLILLGTVTPLTVLLGLVFGQMYKTRPRLRWLGYITLLPFILPGVVIGVSMIQAYSTLNLFGLSLSGSAFLLVAAITIRRLPVILKPIEAGFAKIDLGQEEAARSLGAGELKSFISVIYPQIRVSVYSAIVIGLIKVVTELASSLIIYPPGWRNMSLYVAYYVSEGFISQASAMAVLMILLVGLGTALSNYLSSKENKKYV
ncbi:iron ABC transporter permease [Treponema sp.]